MSLHSRIVCTVDTPAAPPSHANCSDEENPPAVRSQTPQPSLPETLHRNACRKEDFNYLVYISKFISYPHFKIQASVISISFFVLYIFDFDIIILLYFNLYYHFYIIVFVNFSNFVEHFVIFIIIFIICQ